jgi:hypothetical protein
MKSTASELFEKGVQAMQAGKWEECRAALLAAWAIHRNYQIAGNLAECETKLSRFGDAAGHLTFFLREMPATAPAERRARGEELLREVRPKVAELKVRVSKADADVLLDGKSIGRSPLNEPLFVEPGDHKLEAKLGSEAAQGNVSAQGGETHEVTLTFDRETKPPPPKSLVPLIALGAGAVAVGAVGGGLLGAWSGKRAEVQSTSESILTAGASCIAGAANFDARCTNLEKDARTAETLNRAGIGMLLGASALALGAGAYWLFWPAPSTQQGARLIPVASAHGGGAVLIGSF